MLNWELPLDVVPCPHCHSTDTRIKLQLLGLIRYGCNGCRKSFAVDSTQPLTESAAQGQS